MKVKYRIPSKDAFGFVEIEYETNNTPDESIADLEQLMEYHKGLGQETGLTAKELDLIIEHMCLGKTVENGTNLWDKATQAQKDQINCLKRALKRIEAKNK